MPFDPEYKKMMTWVAIALALSLIGAWIMVQWVTRMYGS
jgi:hypothetical protein